MLSISVASKTVSWLSTGAYQTALLSYIKLGRFHRLRFQDVLLDRRHAYARNEWAGASQSFGDNQK